MDKRQNKYSIRKFTFGASSILIGSLLSASGLIVSAVLIGISSESSTFFWRLNIPIIFLNISDKLILKVRTAAKMHKTTNITIDPVFPNKP